MFPMADNRRKSGNKEYHVYEVSNWLNEYSSQRYPAYISGVTYVGIISKKTPDGMLSVSIEDVDGHCCSLLKCYKNAKGERYCVFGKHRLYEGFYGPVALKGVPPQMEEAMRSMGVKLIDEWGANL